MGKVLCYNGVPLDSDQRAGQELGWSAETAIAAPSPASRTELGEVLSPSQANGFIDCSARWYFRYARELPDQTTAKQGLGKSVHRAAEFNFRQKLQSRRDLPEGQVVTAFRDAWEEQIGETVFHAGESPLAIGKNGESLVAMYMAEAAPSIQPAAIEQYVSGEIAGVKVRGIVDLVDVEGRVIDLKTVASTPRGVPSSQRFQVATYRQIAPGVTGAARIDSLVKTKTPKLVRHDFAVTDADLMLTETLYPLVQAGIRSGLYFPNRKSMFCSRKNCAYWEACELEYGGKVAGEIEVDA